MHWIWILKYLALHVTPVVSTYPLYILMLYCIISWSTVVLGCRFVTIDLKNVTMWSYPNIVWVVKVFWKKDGMKLSINFPTMNWSLSVGFWFYYFFSKRCFSLKGITKTLRLAAWSVKLQAWRDPLWYIARNNAREHSWDNAGRMPGVPTPLDPPLGRITAYYQKCLITHQ